MMLWYMLSRKGLDDDGWLFAWEGCSAADRSVRIWTASKDFSRQHEFRRRQNGHQKCAPRTRTGLINISAAPGNA